MTQMKPLLLDLFCGAGGAAMGYSRGGFDILGVDIKPQPNYFFPFIQGDALEVGRALIVTDRIDMIHASPPCQAYSTTRTLHTAEYPKLIEPVRMLLDYSGLPYVIENVVGAPLLNPTRLCGSAFGLGVRRHRLFETSWPVMFPPTCDHASQPEPIDVTGTGAQRLGPRLDGKGGNSRKPRNLTHAREVMGIDWMSRRELSEAVPPAYTEWLARDFLRVMELRNPSSDEVAS